MNRKQKRRFSLKWGLMGIIIGCWVVPILLILGSLIYYADHSVRRQFDDTVQTAISNAAATSRRGMRAAVAASRNASYDGTIRTEYLRYKSTENSQLLYERLQAFLAKQYRYDDNFRMTMLFLVEDPANIYYTFNPALEAPYTRVVDYREKAHGEVIRLSRTLDTQISFVNAGGNVYMVRNIVDNNFKPYAVIVMQLDTAALFGSFDGIMWQAGTTVFLNGTPVSIGAPPEGGAPVAQPEDFALYPGEQRTVSEADAIHVYGRESIDAVEIFYTVEIDLQLFFRGFSRFIDVFYLLLLLLIPLLALAIWFFYRNIFSPMDKLSSAAQIIQEGELGYQIEGRARNAELEYLTQAFNAMSARLKRQFEHIYNEELALRDARIMALQSQINPHFLNNTLEIINWEARLDNSGKVSKMIEALSTMLDAAMNRNSLPLVPLSQEMQYVNAYLYIISERFGKRLSVTKEIDPALLQCEVPRLMMQPIIENAVEHGVAPMQSGAIVIRAKRDGGHLLLEVENNRPLSEKDRETVEKLLSDDYDAKSGGSLHLGIHNVNLRLKMIYGEQSRFSIVSAGSGTVASARIPICQE